MSRKATSTEEFIKRYRKWDPEWYAYQQRRRARRAQLARLIFALIGLGTIALVVLICIEGCTHTTQVDPKSFCLTPCAGIMLAPIGWCSPSVIPHPIDDSGRTSADAGPNQGSY